MDSETVKEDGHWLAIPGCQLSCPIAQFRAIVAPVLPTAWATECLQTVDSNGDNDNSSQHVVLALTITTACVFVLIFSVAYWRKRARANRHALYSIQKNIDGYPFGGCENLDSEADADAFSLGEDEQDDRAEV